MGPSAGIASAFSMKPASRTPATVSELPFNVMLLPTIRGSELNSRFQMRLLKTATTAFPFSSSGLSSLPYCGFAPSIWNKAEDV
jgi:hypothetical protein